MGRALRLCNFPGCGRKHVAKGLCSGHRAQSLRGVPLRELHPRGQYSKRELIEWWLRNKSQQIGDCIVAVTNQKRDYPQIRLEGRAQMLHRVCYEVFHGPTRGQEVHHKCGVSRCFNPDHLQLVSQKDNIAEMKERNAYINRIQDLELALFEVRPDHPLLEGISDVLAFSV